MTIELTAFQFIGLVFTVLGMAGTVIRVLWSRIEGSLKQSFEATTKQIEDTNKQIELISRQTENAQNEIRNLERDFLIHKAELPTKYVAREDYIRGQTVIEAKLDAVAQKLENVQIKQGMQK